jgi:addiction module HigA family antidote
MTKKLGPIHPGEVLLEEFLKPLFLSQNRLALDIRIPARRINEIVHGKRRISPATLICRRSSGWGLQMDYDLDVAEYELAEQINREVRAYSAT